MALTNLTLMKKLLQRLSSAGESKGIIFISNFFGFYSSITPVAYGLRMSRAIRESALRANLPSGPRCIFSFFLTRFVNILVHYSLTILTNRTAGIAQFTSPARGRLVELISQFYLTTSTTFFMCRRTEIFNMNMTVHLARKYNKIFNSVIQFVLVDVMHMQPFWNRLSSMLLNNISMFQNSFIGNRNYSVPIFRDAPSSVVSVSHPSDCFTSTFYRTEPLYSSFGRTASRRVAFSAVFTNLLIHASSIRIEPLKNKPDAMGALC